MGLIINKQSAPQKPSIIDLRKKTVLVIDDFRNFRSIIVNMMRSFGITDIDQAATGEAAIKMLADKKYDIIFCDYNLGEGKDGQQILEEGKHRGFITAGTIFIMVTAENMSNMVLGAIEYIPDDYLIKPITPGVLHGRLEKLIKKKQEFENIQQALDRKDYQTVMALCDQGIQINPTSPYDYLQIKAEALIETGQYDQARELYEDIMKDRYITWASMGIGKIHYYMNEYARAQEIFESVIAKNSMIMEAYDWLAKTQTALDQPKEAQQTLMTATKLSPKVVVRQKTLGEVAYKNKDLDVAAQSFRSAISVGKNSFFKSPSEYMGLAKVLVDTNSEGEALNIVTDAKREFKNNPEVFVRSAAVESVIYNKKGDTERAAKAIEEGSRYFAEAAVDISPQAAMDLAKACFLVGSTEQATQLMQNVVKNHHDDERLMKEAQDVFKDANRSDEGMKLISETKQEMIVLNNKGVDLFDKGKLDEAISLFETAANTLPGNKIINANAAYTLLLYMKANGKNIAMLKKARFYLDRVHNTDPHYAKYYTILAMMKQLLEDKIPDPVKED